MCRKFLDANNASPIFGGTSSPLFHPSPRLTIRIDTFVSAMCAETVWSLSTGTLWDSKGWFIFGSWIYPQPVSFNATHFGIKLDANIASLRISPIVWVGRMTPVAVSTGINTFLIGNPYKSSLATMASWVWYRNKASVVFWESIQDSAWRLAENPPKNQHQKIDCQNHFWTPSQCRMLGEKDITPIKKKTTHPFKTHFFQCFFVLKKKNIRQPQKPRFRSRKTSSFATTGWWPRSLEVMDFVSWKIPEVKRERREGHLPRFWSAHLGWFFFCFFCSKFWCFLFDWDLRKKIILKLE